MCFWVFAPHKLLLLHKEHVCPCAETATSHLRALRSSQDGESALGYVIKCG